MRRSLLRPLKRLLTVFAMLALVFAGTRALVRGLPGDPAETLAGESGTPLSVDSLRAEMGLDEPFLPSLVRDARRFVHGDWGSSLFSRKPVAPLVREHFARTLELTALALALGLGVSLWIGVRAAAAPGSRADRACELFGAVSSSLPTPWIGPVLLALFAVRLPLFPVGNDPWLPAITLALSLAGQWSRLVRERVGETLATGAAPGARARGLSERRILIKYGLVPASPALLAYLGTQAGGLLAGAFVTETLFDWRGMGNLLLEAVLKRDYPVIEAAVFVAAAASLAGTIAGDWLARLTDPRAREADDGGSA
jgi:peptide/nickel transport system permease protein